MGTQVKTTRVCKMTANDIKTIDKLMTKGLTASEISDITGRSKAGVTNYMLIIRTLRAGKPLNINPSRYSADALAEYATSKGLPAVVNLYGEQHEEQTQIEFEPNERPIANDTVSVLSRIATALEQIAERLKVVDQ